MSNPPQPSATGPQFAPKSAQVLGTQVLLPQTLCVPPPPQVWPLGQVPQLSSPPQLSAIGPQFAPNWAHVLGVQVHTPLTQVEPDAHLLPQAPQLLGSLLVFTQVVPQSVVPLGQEVTHCPPVHV